MFLITFERVEDDTGDMVPVEVFYNVAQRDPEPESLFGRTFSPSDPLVQVASARCPARTDPNLICWLIRKRLHDASRAAAKGNHFERPLERPIVTGDVISIGELYFTFSGFGFAPLPSQPPRLTRFLALPDLR